MILVLATPHKDNPATVAELQGITDAVIADNKLDAVTGVWALTGQSKDANALPAGVAAAYGVPFRGFSVDWKRYGRAAAKVATARMLHHAAREEGDAIVLGIWDGINMGCALTLALALSGGLPTVGVIANTGDDDDDDGGEE